MSDLAIHPTALDGLCRIVRPQRGDARGFFSRFFDADRFAELGWPGPVVQMNHTQTAATGTIRGLHFQRAPHSEWKYVSCLRGSVFDVAVDLRRRSATYGQWYGAVLSADNGHSLCIPAGFAHGFQTLESDCEMIYLHSAAYAPASEGGIDALDVGLGIAWPLPVSSRSDRDIALPILDQETGL